MGGNGVKFSSNIQSPLEWAVQQWLQQKNPWCHLDPESFHCLNLHHQTPDHLAQDLQKQNCHLMPLLKEPASAIIIKVQSGLEVKLWNNLLCVAIIAGSCYAAKDHLLSGMSWAAPQLARRVSKSWAGCACCHAPQSWSSGDPRATEAPGVGEGPWRPRCTHPTTSGQRPTEGWRRQEKRRYIFKWHIKPRRHSRNIIETRFIYTLPTSGNICHYPDLTKHCLWI